MHDGRLIAIRGRFSGRAAHSSCGQQGRENHFSHPAVLLFDDLPIDKTA
jgi:hypothetical protein